jgi:N-alpha-acetyltransferase 15/16, NatA auxiliary subunit
LKCLLALRAIDPPNPALHVYLYRFREILDHYPDGSSIKTSEVISSEARKLFPEDKDSADWNSDFLARHRSSALHVQAGLRVRGLIDKSKKEVNEKELIATLALETISMPEASAGLELLNDWSSSAEVKDKYRNSAAERWKQASVFATKHI